MAVNYIENSAEIQALKKQYEEAAASGAGKEVLDSIHAAAEKLRNAAGYASNDKSGETFHSIYNEELGHYGSAGLMDGVSQNPNAKKKTVSTATNSADLTAASGSKTAIYILIGVFLVAVLGGRK